MITVDDIKSIVGEEFDVREVEDSPWFVDIRLCLTSTTRVHKKLLEPATKEQLLFERDRILVKFKVELTKLLYKYLGER